MAGALTWGTPGMLRKASRPCCRLEDQRKTGINSGPQHEPQLNGSNRLACSWSLPRAAGGVGK